MILFVFGAITTYVGKSVEPPYEPLSVSQHIELGQHHVWGHLHTLVTAASMKDVIIECWPIREQYY